MLVTNIHTLTYHHSIKIPHFTDPANKPIDSTLASLHYRNGHQQCHLADHLSDLHTLEHTSRHGRSTATHRSHSSCFHHPLPRLHTRTIWTKHKWSSSPLLFSALRLGSHLASYPTYRPDLRGLGQCVPEIACRWSTHGFSKQRRVVTFQSVSWQMFALANALDYILFLVAHRFTLLDVNRKWIARHVENPVEEHASLQERTLVETQQTKPNLYSDQRQPKVNSQF